MASSRRNQQGEATVKAVLVYAAQLRERADTALAADPHRELYRPSNDAARKVSQQFGPEQALVVLATRARKAEMRYEEANGRADVGRERHLRLQLVVAGERAAETSALSLGQRLDVAMLGLEMLPGVGSSRLDADRVSSGRSESSLPVSRRDRQVGGAVADAEAAVARLERLVAQSRRRLVEEESAA